MASPAPSALDAAQPRPASIVLKLMEIPERLELFAPFLADAIAEAQPGQSLCALCGTLVDAKHGIRSHRGKGPCHEAQKSLVAKLE